MILLLLWACATPPEGELIFVRDGVIGPLNEGQLLANGQRFLARAWKPGETVTLPGAAGVAPARPECLAVGSVELGDVARLIAMGGSAPDTALAWSPDSRWLAIGSYRGEVLVVDGWTGAVRVRRSFAEATIKQVDWSPDGGTLYVAEQSPDAFVHALDPATLTARWSLRLADRVETSPAPDGADIYGIYTLPAAYGLEVLPDGDLIVAAVHGWNAEEGRRRNLSQILRVAPDGSVRRAWPDAPADVTLMHPRIDGDLLVVPVGRSSEGPAPDLPINGVQVLRLSDLSPVSAHQLAPLEPWFKSVFLWESVDISAAQQAVMLGAGDGRVQVQGLNGQTLLALDTGAPVMAGDVPIAASVGHGFFHNDQLLFLTSGTQIPYGAAAPDLRPPSAHPNENTVWVYGQDGKLRWSYHGQHMVQGLTARDALLVVGAGERMSDTRRDLYGALLFDLTGEGRAGAERLITTCRTEGPVFFRQAIAADGRIAVTEFPYVEADGRTGGAYRVTVFR